MSISRRDLLAGVCASGAAGMLGCGAVGKLGRGPSEAEESKKVSADNEFSFVHMTDMHVTPKRNGGEGYRACAKSVRELKCKPEFALMGGDLGFDGNYNTKADFETFIKLYKDGSDEMGIPYYNCMGNHDVLGWSKARKVSVDDPELGKKMIMDRLGWEKSYYSFDRNGWHFVMLDSIYPVQADHGPTYEGRIGEEQLEWLAYDLGAAGGRPTVAVTHIAAFCNIGQINGDPEAKAINHMVLRDTKELRTILERHKVKALLQGHSHMIEEYHYNGVWYITSAAASGAWWSGDWVGSPQGYTVFHCKGEELTWEHVTFPWVPQLDPKDDLERKKTAEKEAFRAEQKRLLERERAGVRG